MVYSIVFRNYAIRKCKNYFLVTVMQKIMIAEKLTFLMAFPLFALTVYIVVKRANVRSTVVIITLVHVLSIDSPEKSISQITNSINACKFFWQV